MTMFALVTTADRLIEFSASFPHLYAPIIFTVPRGHEFFPIEKLFLPFEMPVWFFVIFVSCDAGLVALLAFLYGKRAINFLFGRNNNNPLLNYFNILFGGPITRLPTRNFARTLFSIWVKQF